jgi:hypothetical protein
MIISKDFIDYVFSILPTNTLERLIVNYEMVQEHKQGKSIKEIAETYNVEYLKAWRTCNTIGTKIHYNSEIVNEFKKTNNIK